MLAVKIAQYVMATLAMIAIVASLAFGWGLTEGVMLMLAGVVGWAAPRPSDMLAPKE